MRTRWRVSRILSVCLAGSLLFMAEGKCWAGQQLIVPIPTYPLTLTLDGWEDAHGVAYSGRIEAIQANAITVGLADRRYMTVSISARTELPDQKLRLLDRVAFSAYVLDRQLIADSIQLLSHAPVSSIGKNAAAVSTTTAATVSTAASAPTPDPVILKTRDEVNQYSKLLPDFICEQTTRRYVKNPRTGDWSSLDNYSVEVLFSSSAGETYRDLRVNGQRITKSLMDMKGSVSTGEFGSLLRSILRNTQPSDFTFIKEARVEKRPAREYAFRVPKERSDWEVASDYQFILPAYRGRIWIDAETNRVLRLERQADDIPHAFPIEKVKSSLEYGNIRLSTDGNLYLLPTRANMLGCQRNNGVCDRNEIAFDHYRKYTEDSKLIF